MRTLLVMVALFVLSSSTLAEEIAKIQLPLEVREEIRIAPNDPDIQGKVWNRWTSKNFVVCALNDTQAQYLHGNLESIKAWIYQRWGFFDIDFSAECRIICVDDARLFSKMFRINTSQAEIRRGSDGKIRLNVVFLLADAAPSKVLPISLTEVCLAEAEQRYQCKFGWWVHRGIALLNEPIDSISANIVSLKLPLSNDSQMFFSKGLLSCSQSIWEGYDSQKKALYDKAALVFCLLVRKEFGQDNFLKMITAEGTSGLKAVLHFNDESQFDRTLKRYIVDLTNDIEAGKTPISYLQIRQK